MAHKEYGKAELDKEFKEFKAKQESIQSRASQLKLVHEDSVIVQRFDINTLTTFLHMEQAAASMRKHESWYGKILLISDIDSGDDIRETKKKLVKVGDVVTFNAEVPYSLNLKGFEYDIYVISINNIICIDTDFNMEKKYLEILEKRIGMPI